MSRSKVMNPKEFTQYFKKEGYSRTGIWCTPGVVYVNNKYIMVVIAMKQYSNDKWFYFIYEYSFETVYNKIGSCAIRTTLYGVDIFLLDRCQLCEYYDFEKHNFVIEVGYNAMKKLCEDKMKKETTKTNDQYYKKVSGIMHADDPYIKGGIELYLDKEQVKCTINKEYLVFRNLESGSFNVVFTLDQYRNFVESVENDIGKYKHIRNCTINRGGGSSIIINENYDLCEYSFFGKFEVSLHTFVNILYTLLITEQNSFDTALPTIKAGVIIEHPSLFEYNIKDDIKINFQRKEVLIGKRLFTLEEIKTLKRLLNVLTTQLSFIRKYTKRIVMRPAVSGGPIDVEKEVISLEVGGKYSCSFQWFDLTLGVDDIVWILKAFKEEVL